VNSQDSTIRMALSRFLRCSLESKLRPAQIKLIPYAHIEQKCN